MRSAWAVWPKTISKEPSPGISDALVDSYQEQTGGRVVIVDGSGIAVADSEPPSGATASVGRSFASRPEIAAALDGETSSLERRSETLDDTVFVVAAPVRSGDRIIGAVRVSRSTHELAEEVLRYRLALASIAVFALALSAALGFLTGRWATRPIRRLQHAAAVLGRNDFRTRADTEHGPPEVRDLARRFNSMADRVDRLIQTSQQFAADASHQLRTPLTAIRLRLDSLVDEPGSADPALVHALVDDVDRLQRTIDGLLALTRIDQSKVRPETLGLAELIVERCDMWRPLAEEARVEFLPDVGDGCEGYFDRNHLDQVLDNLIDNALAHAPEGSTVEFRAEADAERVELHVTDHGPGIAGRPSGPRPRASLARTGRRDRNRARRLRPIVRTQRCHSAAR